MGLLDYFRRRKPSRIQAYLDSNQNNLEKEARTPVYDMAPAMGSTGPMRLDPVYDLFYLEQLAEQYSHLQSVITKIASQTVAKGYRLEQLTETPSED